MKQVTKLLIELGPLGVFFLAYNRFDIFTATGAFMVATIVSLIASKFLLQRIATMPLVTGVVVMVMGGLTLWLQDSTFIKLKPTIVNAMFGLILLVGLYFNRLFLKIVFEEAFELKDEGWRKLTIRWGLFFLFLALLNEVIWRNFSEAFWVGFKTFGVFPLTLIFSIAQLDILQKFQIDNGDEGEESQA